MTSQEEKGHVPDTRRTDVTSKYTVRTITFLNWRFKFQVSGLLICHQITVYTGINY